MWGEEGNLVCVRGGERYQVCFLHAPPDAHIVPNEFRRPKTVIMHVSRDACGPGVLMIFAKQMRPSCLLRRLRPRRPVGTRGGVGRMRGPCACPGGSVIPLGFRMPFASLHPAPDKHKAPTLPHVRSLSLQDGATSLPYSIVKIHQDGDVRFV